MAGESLTISTKQQLPTFGKHSPQSPKGRLKFLRPSQPYFPLLRPYPDLNLIHYISAIYGKKVV